MHVLRRAGLVSTRAAGTTKPSRLRTSDLERRFPGLLSSIVDASPPRPVRRAAS